MMIMTSTRTRLLAVLLPLLVALLTPSSWTVSAQDEELQEEHYNKCGLYLAISSTSTVDDTNWGLYVGDTDIVGKYSTIGQPEIGIVVTNLRIHNENIVSSKRYKNTIDVMKLVDYFEAFFWVPSTVGAKFVLPLHPNDGSMIGGMRAIAAISGSGVLASYSKHMTNSDWDPLSTYHRPFQNDGSSTTNTTTSTTTEESHPNRGSYSPYYNCQIMSTTNIIKAGSEIFMEYGESWADKQGDEEGTLVKEDYDKIDITVQKMIEFFHKYNDTILNDDQRIEIYSFIMKDIMKAAVGPIKARKITSILPPNPNDLSLVIEAGGTLSYSDPSSHRSLSFLHKYGLCMDHVYVGPSTIPNIGRGAFAKYALKKDSMVLPIPLTHIVDQSIFNMYPLTTNSDGNVIRASNTHITQQLIVNYCFGHPQSTMLFYPSGAIATSINHSRDKPNAKLVWSTHPNHQKIWYDLDPIPTLMEEEYMYMGLIMEVVALRDIEPNEEIFIDYGVEWQAAYDAHVIAWNKKVQQGILPKVWPITAVAYNTQYYNITSKTIVQPYPTKMEQQQQSDKMYPNHLMLVGFLQLKDTENVGTIHDPKLWNDNDGTDSNRGVYNADYLYEIASIIDRHEIKSKDSTTIKYTYTIEWISSSSTVDDENETGGSIVVVTNVPHEAMMFVERPIMIDGTTSTTTIPYEEHMFRHYIGIPDTIFPHGPWRNLV